MSQPPRPGPAPRVSFPTLSPGSRLYFGTEAGGSALLLAATLLVPACARAVRPPATPAMPEAAHAIVPAPVSVQPGTGEPFTITATTAVLVSGAGFVTAASLFDGHDASINIMRRILQASGAEVIHLGHNRSVGEVVNAALQEDVQAIAITSYQGGHVEYFKYMLDLLRENGGADIKVFGGGGGVIVLT